MDRRIVPDLVSNQDLTTLHPEATVREAAQLMAEKHIGAVMVIEDRQLAGIFTERDLLTRVVSEGLDPETTPLSAVMTADPDTIGPNDRAFDALERMSSRGYRHLPVVEDGVISGIVSIRDLFKAVNEQLAQDLKQRDQLLFDTGYGSG